MTQFHKNLPTRRFHNHTGYDATDYFRLEVIDVQTTVENAVSDGFAIVYIEKRLS